MGKINIFEDGYLLPEFINPEYRGLVGWPIKVEVCDYTLEDGFMLSIDGDNVFMKDDNCNIDFLEVEIPRFTPEDIPVGELCWCRSDFQDDAGWQLLVVDKAWINAPEVYRGNVYVVPYLIAKDEKQAEERKDWANND